MAEDNKTPDVLSSGLTVGRVYAAKIPALIQGLGGQLYADDRQITELAGDAPDDLVTHTNAAGGAPVTTSLSQFVDWADKDVTDLLPPSLPGEDGETHVHWRPWHTVSGSQHTAAKVNEAPDAATAGAQLAPVRIIDGHEADMGGTPMPDDKAASAAPAPKTEPKTAKKTADSGKVKAAAAASKAKGKTASVDAAGVQGAAKATATKQAAAVAPVGPNVLAGVGGVPVAGAPAVLGAHPAEGADTAPKAAAPGALGIDTASNDGGNETGSQNETTANMVAAQQGHVPGTTGGTAQQPSEPPKH